MFLGGVREFLFPSQLVKLTETNIGTERVKGLVVFFTCSFSMDIWMIVELSMDVVCSAFATNHAPIDPPSATHL